MRRFAQTQIRAKGNSPQQSDCLSLIWGNHQNLDKKIEGLAYIVGCRSDYCDNLILRSPVVKNKTFDGIIPLFSVLCLYMSRLDVGSQPLIE